MILFWLETLPLLVVALVFGAAVGSFLNVVVYRLPAGLSLVYPPSRCPKCLHRLGPGDNVPILGWLILGGRCRYCRAPIAPRYPLVEALTALLFVGVALRYGFSWLTLTHSLLLAWLLALALIDLDTLTLPNRLTKPGLVVGLVVQVLIGASQGGGPGAIAGLLSGILGMTLGLWLLDAIAFGGSIAFGRTAMGSGDAKLAALLGAWLGGPLFLVAGFFACLTGALAGGLAIALGRLKRHEPMPFGPFLAIGGAVAVFAGPNLLAAYLAQF